MTIIKFENTNGSFLTSFVFVIFQICVRTLERKSKSMEKLSLRPLLKYIDEQPMLDDVMK
jgi:hypothetical protein